MKIFQVVLLLVGADFAKVRHCILPNSTYQTREIVETVVNILAFHIFIK